MESVFKESKKLEGIKTENVYPVHTPINALLINLVKSFKFTLKYTIIRLPHNTHATVRHAATSPNLYNDVILPSVLT